MSISNMIWDKVTNERRSDFCAATRHTVLGVSNFCGENFAAYALQECAEVELLYDAINSDTKHIIENWGSTL